MNGPLITCAHPGCTVARPVTAFHHGDEDRGVYCDYHQTCDTGEQCDVCIGDVYAIGGILGRVLLRSVEREIADTQHEVSLLTRDLTRLGDLRLQLKGVAA